MLQPSILRREGSCVFQPDDLEGGLGGAGLDENGADAPTVRLHFARHATPDIQPFVVEPAEAVIKGGESARFVVRVSPA